MSKKSIGIMGALSAISAGPAMAAHAAPAPAVPPAGSYADLLQPIPNAVERLKLAEAEDDARPAVLIRAQFVVPLPHHHHHHHHHRRHHRHHHHHHHNHN
jgi:hypothetical protein